MYPGNSRVLCPEFGWVRFLLDFFVCTPYMKSIPTHEKLFAVGNSGPNATFNLIFLGLGWPLGWCRVARCMERDARFAAGLESSFSSFGETSLVVLTHRCQMLNGGEAAEGA